MSNYNCKTLIDSVQLRGKVARHLACDGADFRVDQAIWEMIKNWSDVLSDAKDDSDAILMLSMRVGMTPPNKEVLQFITQFRKHTAGGEDAIRQQFISGYCWHFAHILMEVFQVGEVCWCAPYSHFVWLYNGVPYDINGVSSTGAEHFIPEEYLGAGLKDFIHKPGDSFNASEDYIQQIITNYLEERNT